MSVFSAIEGQVTYKNMNPLPGTTVSLQKRVTVTDAAGRYRFRDLEPNNYQITFQLEGFKTVKESVKTSVGRASVINVKMQVQTIQEQL